jgi:hypothetical protein
MVDLSDNSLRSFGFEQVLRLGKSSCQHFTIPFGCTKCERVFKQPLEAKAIYLPSPV